MLGLVYNLSPPDAMWFTQFCHDMRACPMGVPSPQTDEQRHQVVRVLSSVRARRKRQQDVRFPTLHCLFVCVNGVCECVCVRGSLRSWVVMCAPRGPGCVPHKLPPPPSPISHP
jgi:hypothetical protein